MPISLLVTSETVKFIQSIFMASDEKMYTKKSDTHCVVNSSNLNEELGQISHVFSDKTGTLTCNEMIFKKLIVNGRPYGIKCDRTCTIKFTKVSNVDFHDPDFFNNMLHPKIQLYLKFLSLCHMIITEEKEDGEIVYNSSSPDEIALTNFGKYCGYEFRGMNEKNQMSVLIDGKLKVFTLHYVLDFTSKR